MYTYVCCVCVYIYIADLKADQHVRENSKNEPSYFYYSVTDLNWQLCKDFFFTFISLVISLFKSKNLSHSLAK